MQYEVNKENLIKAFKKLKAHYFYNSDPMFMKAKIIEFEQNIDERIENLLVLYNTSNLDSIVKQIRYRIIPKKEAASKIETSICINAINFFIDAPIEFHLLDIIWIFNIIDNNRNDFDSQYIYGNKLKNSIWSSKDKLSTRFIFENYNVMYNEWKNKCFLIASYLNVRNNIEIYNFDIKQYYYNQKINFVTFFEKYGQYNSEKLNQFIKNGYCYYDALVNEKNDRQVPNTSMLIIGLISSAIISNSSLMELDTKFASQRSVIYYGRYVDDVLIIKTNNDSLHGKIACLSKKNALDKLEKWMPDLICYDDKNEPALILECFLPINIDKMNYYYFGENKYNNSKLKDEIKEKIFCSNELVLSESELDNYDTWSLGHNLLKSLRKLLFNVDKTINDETKKVNSLVNEIIDDHITINFRTIWKDILYYYREEPEKQMEFYKKCSRDIDLITNISEINNKYGKTNNKENICILKKSLKAELKIALAWASMSSDLSNFYYNNFKFDEIEQFIKQLLNYYLIDNIY